MKNKTFLFCVLLIAGILLTYQTLFTGSATPTTTLAKAHSTRSKTSITVIIPPYSNTFEIARRLVSSGVITQPWGLVLTAFISGKHTFDPGIYTFQSNMTSSDVIDMLKKNCAYKITIPEGLTVAEIARLLNEKSFLTGGIFSLPDEGMLLPETYCVNYGDTREKILKRLEMTMKTTLATLFTDINEKTIAFQAGIKTPKDLLTLASIVEKETRLVSERAHVAGVFLNRLMKKMRLQSDPTVVYAITHGKQPLGRSLTKSDLATLSPINTYTTSGLPPQPIACPGKAALTAVLAPDKTDDLYFVADGTGGHRFSETLDGHNKNVSHWRRVRNNTGQ